MGTEVEATPYREIPTDGTAVLGMTGFCMVAMIFAFPFRKVKGGSRPSPTIVFSIVASGDFGWIGQDSHGFLLEKVRFRLFY